MTPITKETVTFVADQLVRALRFKLPAGIMVEGPIYKHQHEARRATVTLRTTDNCSYSFTISPETDWSTSLRLTVERAVIRGDAYNAEPSLRRTKPHAAPRKDGSYNFDALAKHAIAAIARKRSRVEYQRAVNEAADAGAATFAKACELAGANPDPKASAFSMSFGPALARITKRNSKDGTVYVELKLNVPSAMTPEEAVALLRKLERLG